MLGRPSKANQYKNKKNSDDESEFVPPPVVVYFVDTHVCEEASDKGEDANQAVPNATEKAGTFVWSSVAGETA